MSKRISWTSLQRSLARSRTPTRLRSFLKQEAKASQSNRSVPQHLQAKAYSHNLLRVHALHSDLRRHHRCARALRRISNDFNTANLRMTAVQTLGVTSHCGAIVWDAGHVQPPPCLLQLALNAVTSLSVATGTSCLLLSYVHLFRAAVSFCPQLS